MEIRLDDDGIGKEWSLVLESKNGTATIIAGLKRKDLKKIRELFTEALAE